ncbi:MAG: hypothetical protein K1X44_04680 [Alphaproteobacteria bacterium]|nr:hypothetical protein [Alphaproteobacteria bacterium]
MFKKNLIYLFILGACLLTNPTWAQNSTWYSEMDTKRRELQHVKFNDGSQLDLIYRKSTTSDQLVPGRLEGSFKPGSTVHAALTDAFKNGFLKPGAGGQVTGTKVVKGGTFGKSTDNVTLEYYANGDIVEIYPDGKKFVRYANLGGNLVINPDGSINLSFSADSGRQPAYKAIVDLVNKNSVGVRKAPAFVSNGSKTIHVAAPPPLPTGGAKPRAFLSTLPTYATQNKVAKDAGSERASTAQEKAGPRAP